MKPSNRDLMRVLSESHAMVCQDGHWFSSTVREARFKSFDVTIEVRERT